MTRKSRREIERAVDDLDDSDGGGSTVWVVPFAATPEDTDVDLSPFIVTAEPGGADPIDTHQHVELPIFKPRSAGGGVTVLDAADVRALWERQPDAVREREREYRIEHDKPIPPVLQESA